jgi:hypothetical protein
MEIYIGTEMRIKNENIYRDGNENSSYFTGIFNLLAGFSLLIFEVSRSHTMTR